MLQRLWNTDKRWQNNVITPPPNSPPHPSPTLETPPPKPTIWEAANLLLFPHGSPWKLATWRIITDDFSTFPRTVWSSRFLDGLAALITELSDAEVLRNRALMRICFTAGRVAKRVKPQIMSECPTVYTNVNLKVISVMILVSIQKSLWWVSKILHIHGLSPHLLAFGRTIYQSRARLVSTEHGATKKFTDHL